MARLVLGRLLIHAGAHTTLRSRVVASREWHEANLGRALCHARLQVDLGALVARRRTATTHSTLIGRTRILFLDLSIHVAAGTRVTAGKGSSPSAEIGRLLLSDASLVRLAAKQYLLRPARLHGLIEVHRCSFLGIYVLVREHVGALLLHILVLLHAALVVRNESTTLRQQARSTRVVGLLEQMLSALLPIGELVQ